MMDVSDVVRVVSVAASGGHDRFGGEHPEEPQVRGVLQGVRAAEDVLLALHRLPPQTQSKVRAPCCVVLSYCMNISMCT